MVLKVLSIEGLPLRKEERNVPGSKGLGYFLEGKDMIDRSGAKASESRLVKNLAFHKPSEFSGLCSYPSRTTKPASWQAC